MDAATVHEDITAQLLRKLEESRFLNVPLMDRIEGRLSSRKQLERYIGLLVDKLEQTDFRANGLIDRIDAMTKELRRLEQRERA